jgi:hypothetical protein
MSRILRKTSIAFVVSGALWLANGEVSLDHVRVVAEASAVVGAPVTPVSYAGVARRSTVGVGAPGVGVTPAPGVGVGAPGVGVTPAPGVNTPANRGGPVNRVGRR